MAKGNLFQGMARGKVGDVVFSRLNGQQVSRVRNRNPKNPKTNAQLYTRAIMATVMRAYSMGIAIFNHAFQGFSVGAANQRRFLSLNNKRLREAMAAALAVRAAGDTPSATQEVFVSGPGVLYSPVNRLQVSEGTLSQTLFFAFGAMAPANENETVAQYCARHGLVSGDIFTLVMFNYGGNVQFAVSGVSDIDEAVQKQSEFIFIRLILKDAALTDTTLITDATTKAAFFDIDSQSSQYGAPLTTAYKQNLLIDDELPFEGGLKSAAVIRSRVDEDLRSTSFMEIDVTQGIDSYGISSAYALRAWKQGTVAIGDSDLILEGGDV